MDFSSIHLRITQQSRLVIYEAETTKNTTRVEQWMGIQQENTAYVTTSILQHRFYLTHCN